MPDRAVSALVSASRGSTHVSAKGFLLRANRSTAEAGTVSFHGYAPAGA
jgi:hypothetical protein